MVDHFYAVDQWDVEDRGQGGKVIVHVPCGWDVEQATFGDKWVCTGCFEEIPEAIGDLIILGNLYKPHWDPITYPGPLNPFAFYANINWPSINPSLFYMFMDPYTYTPSGFGFYFHMAGTGTYFI